MMGVNQMGMRPLMIGPMRMDMGGRGQSFMGVMQGPGPSMGPQTPRPPPMKTGIEDPWPDLMQTAQLARWQRP